jgi:hypothetical protein
MGRQVTRLGSQCRERDCTQPSWKKKPRETVVLDGKIILKWISKKLDVSVWTGFIWLRIGTGEKLYRTQQ